MTVRPEILVATSSTSQRRAVARHCSATAVSAWEMFVRSVCRDAGTIAKFQRWGSILGLLYGGWLPDRMVRQAYRTGPIIVISPVLPDPSLIHLNFMMLALSPPVIVPVMTLRWIPLRSGLGGVSMWLM